MKGNIIKYARDNIDTDVIIPGQYLKVHDYAELATHAMEGLDPDFHSKVKEGDFILSGKNFGCGSSREHAPIALSHCGVKAILALSFARIFYHYAVNPSIAKDEKKLETNISSEKKDSKNEIKNITKYIIFDNETIL